ncbi:hypothetical protein LCGC14_2611470 [marine sediment metagenome]|uniref:Uncharacterized protein n=1 Tax=marine sediment metagenome TaxID=412755 RepID=A0A0F9A5Z8_9ZZZZ
MLTVLIKNGGEEKIVEAVSVEWNLETGVHIVPDMKENINIPRTAKSDVEVFVMNSDGNTVARYLS